MELLGHRGTNKAEQCRALQSVSCYIVVSALSTINSAASKLGGILTFLPLCRKCQGHFLSKMTFFSLLCLQQAAFYLSYQQQLLQPPDFSFWHVFLFSQIFHLVELRYHHQYNLLLVIVNSNFIQNVMHTYLLLISMIIPFCLKIINVWYFFLHTLSTILISPQKIKRKKDFFHTCVSLWKNTNNSNISNMKNHVKCSQ